MKTLLRRLSELLLGCNHSVCVVTPAHYEIEDGEIEQCMKCQRYWEYTEHRKLLSEGYALTPVAELPDGRWGS